MKTAQKILPPGREGAKMLANDLRRAIPDNFVWDFGTPFQNLSTASKIIKEEFGRSCGFAGCAMGYAQVFYSNIKYYEDLADHLDMDDENAEDIFYLSKRFYPGKEYGDVTPNDVANALDRWLEETA